MNDPTNHTFRTKTGTCTITPEQIILMREGVRRAIAEQGIGSSIGRVLLIYSGFGLVTIAFGFGIWSLMDGGTVAGLILCLVAGIFLWSVAANRRNSAAPVIDRSAIRRVEAHAPRPPATRGYFAVLFEENGKERKRLIMLPGSMENGGVEYARATAVMRDAGLLMSD